MTELLSRIYTILVYTDLTKKQDFASQLQLTSQETIMQD